MIYAERMESQDEGAELNYCAFLSCFEILIDSEAASAVIKFNSWNSTEICAM